MRLLTAASLAACLALPACAESPAFRHATYLGYPYEYDDASGLPVLDHNKPRGNFDHEVTPQAPIMLSRDDVREPKPKRVDPGLLFVDPFRGRNY